MNRSGKSSTFLIGGVALAVLLSPVGAIAQDSNPCEDGTLFPESTACSLSEDTDSSISGLPIDLLPPGARSLGLAGAFTAVADDATAALANPAGLTVLTATEVSLHVRDTDTTLGFFDPDAYNNAILQNTGGDVQLVKQYADSGTNVSFASIVKPFDRWVLSAFYTSQLDFSSVQTRPDSFADIHNDGDDIIPITGSVHNNFNAVSTQVQGFGLSAAFRATDTFSIGVSVARAQLDIDAVDFWSSDNGAAIAVSSAAFNAGAGLGDFDELLELFKLEVIEDISISGDIIDEDDSDLVYNVGLMYRPNESWSFGLVYSKGAEFEVNSVTTVLFDVGCTGETGEATNCEDVLPVVDLDRFINGTEKFGLPDLLTLGIAWRPSDTWLISFDAKRIGYGSVNQVRQFTQWFGFDVNDEVDRTFARNAEIASLQGPLTEEIKDQTTYHLGVEKVFVRQNNNIFSIRAGGFTVEDVDGTPLIDSDDTVFTAGLGMTFGNAGQFQLDLGASFADATDNIILSGIYRF
jgi:long-subunit fatty acid transport protein